jgi:hypothetical protein
LSELITKLILIVISTIECHVHVNVCTASEVHQSEFFAWSDSSGDSGTEETVIREEEDDVVITPQHTAEAPEKSSSVLRPESLKVKRASSGSHLISFVTVKESILTELFLNLGNPDYSVISYSAVYCRARVKRKFFEDEQIYC